MSLHVSIYGENSSKSNSTSCCAHQCKSTVYPVVTTMLLFTIVLQLYFETKQLNFNFRTFCVMTLVVIYQAL